MPGLILFAFFPFDDEEWQNVIWAAPLLIDNELYLRAALSVTFSLPKKQLPFEFTTGAIILS